MSLTQQQIDQIRALEKHIRLASELDWEANVRGNGINAFEASPVLDEFLDILGLEHIQPTEDEIAEAEETEEY